MGVEGTRVANETAAQQNLEATPCHAACTIVNAPWPVGECKVSCIHYACLLTTVHSLHARHSDSTLTPKASHPAPGSICTVLSPLAVLSRLHFHRLPTLRGCMLAPPMSRAGVPRVGARSRAAEKQNGSRTGSMQALGVEGTAPTGGSLIQVASKGTGSGNNKAQVPLHLRMVSDVEFVVYPFSLIFIDPACEMDYLKSAAERVPTNIRRAALSMLVMFAISIGFDAANAADTPHATPAFPDAHSIYLTRAILAGVCAVLTLVFAAVSKVSIPFHPFPQLLMTALLSVIGSLWAIASVFRNADLPSFTQSGSYLLWLILLHASGRYLFLHLSYVPAAVSTVVYIVTAAYWSSDSEDKKSVAWHCLLSTVASLCVCVFSYRLEFLARCCHISCLKVELGRREKADLRKEAFDLRDEMYVMTLERYDIADVMDKKEMEFKSPMEQAMVKLQTLCENKNIPKDAFLQLQKVIGLLGASDLFKVQVSEALADKLDDETTRYLFDLVNNGDGAYDDTTASAAATTAAAAAAAAAGGTGAGAGAAGSAKPVAGEDSPNLDETASGGMLPGQPTLSHNGGGSSMALLSGFSSSSSSSSSGFNGGAGVGVGGVVPVPTGVLAKEERTVNEILKNMDTYNFDVFEVANLSGGKPLFFVGTALFKKYNLLQKFGIDRSKLSNFLNVIENGYLKNNPYHNGIHVQRTTHRRSSDWERCLICFACLCTRSSLLLPCVPPLSLSALSFLSLFSFLCSLFSLCSLRRPMLLVPSIISFTLPCVPIRLTSKFSHSLLHH